eukprot:SAG31_NODE_1482_length_8175_cov_4.484398_5_plen_54_part_00
MILMRISHDSAIFVRTNCIEYGDAPEIRENEYVMLVNSMTTLDGTSEMTECSE